MIKNILIFIFIIVFFVCAIALSSGDETSPYLVRAYPKVCKHSLHNQPNDGPFSVFLFCDDAAGSHIGVILTKPGAGPGNIELTHPKKWDKWYTYDRFWQDRNWAADVHSFAWSPDLKYLYVATNYVYGNGGFYRLDLVQREVTLLIPSERTPYFTKSNHAYYTEIKDIDPRSGEIKVLFHFFNTSTESRETREILIK